jgi:DNA repair exonuclease SbcCD ATPase subunit
LNLKLEKFIHLVVDRLKFQKDPIATDLSSLIDEISRIEPSCPRSPSQFVRWLPSRFLTLINEISDAQSALSDERERSVSYEDSVPRFQYDKLAEKVLSLEAQLAARSQSESRELTELKRTVRHLSKKDDEIDALRRDKIRLIRENAEMCEASNRKIQQLEARNACLKTDLESHKSKLVARTEYAQENEREKCRDLKHAARERSDETANLRNLLEDVKRDNSKLSAKVDQLQETLRQTKRPELRLVEDSTAELKAKLIQAEIQIADNNAEIRRLRAQLEPVRPVPQPVIVPQRRKSPCACTGCHIDVSKLRRRFDRLEDAIDDLHGTLGKRY